MEKTEMGFKAGDMIKVTTSQYGTGIGFVYNTDQVQPECGVLRASIAWSDGGCSDGLVISEFKTVEKTGMLTEEKGKAIIEELHEFASSVDKYSLGLPDFADHTGEMIHIIRIGLIAETVEA
jgi:hypothetical protein